MDIGIIIPARLKSTRLPGKPLIELCGKSMIQRTWECSIKALPKEKVWIATDDKNIADHVITFGGQVVMTSSSCLTGTDRVAEANGTLKLDIVINVQGDEPIIPHADICEIINVAKKNPKRILNAYANIYDSEEYFSKTIPKLVTNLNNDLLYMSRAPIPGSKSGGFKTAKKQICIYAFPKSELESFKEWGSKSAMEEIEDIEILRFLENGKNIKMVKVSGESIAVDTEADADKVRKIIFHQEQKIK